MRPLILSLSFVFALLFAIPEAATAQTVTIRPRTPFFQPPLNYHPYQYQRNFYYAPTYVVPSYGYPYGVYNPYVVGYPYTTYPVLPATPYYWNAYRSSYWWRY